MEPTAETPSCTLRFKSNKDSFKGVYNTARIVQRCIPQPFSSGDTSGSKTNGSVDLLTGFDPGLNFRQTSAKSGRIHL